MSGSEGDLERPFLSFLELAWLKNMGVYPIVICGRI